MSEDLKNELDQLTDMEDKLRGMIPELEDMRNLDVGGDAKKKALELLTSIHHMTIRALGGPQKNPPTDV